MIRKFHMNQRIQQEIVRGQSCLPFKTSSPQAGSLLGSSGFWDYYISSGLTQHSPRHYYDWPYGGNDHLKSLTGYHNSPLESYNSHAFEKTVEFPVDLR